MSELLYVKQDGVGTITLNRPDRRNAFTYEMLDAFGTALLEARSDSEVRVVLITGAGDGFCSGIDLSVLPLGDPDATATPLEFKRILTERVHPVMLAIEQLDKPSIAAVNGAAVGAGMDFALMCDLRVAGRSARFSEGYIKVGLVPGAGGAYLLPRVVGTPKALELLLTGEFVDADEALRIGLVNSVIDDDALITEARALARRIAALPPIAASMIRRAVYQGERTDLRASLDLVSSHLAVLTTTHDTPEAVAAMRERREPFFRGE